MTTFAVNTEHGTPTIEASAIVTQQQGPWKYQVRLRRAYYVAVYSERTKKWIWKSTGEYSGSFSGGNRRKPLIAPDGTKHNRALNGPELAALAVVRGENF